MKDLRRFLADDKGHFTYDEALTNKDYYQQIRSGHNTKRGDE